MSSYIHVPDAQTPISETLLGCKRSIISVFSSFRPFRLSNDAQKIYGPCKEEGYICSTFYWGHYPAITHQFRTALFPSLQGLGIAFRAYILIAGRFLIKKPQHSTDGAGRFNNNMYGGMYKQTF
jgi:hypothetical protein